MEEVDERRFNRFVNLGITADDMLGMVEGVEARDLQPFRYPSLGELRRAGVRSVCLGSFIPWDVKEQVKVIERELGWRGDEVEGVPPQYSYEKIECYMQGVRDYIKFIKRGYGRTAHLASIDVRNDRLTRDEGLRLVAEYDGKRPASLDLFLEYSGLNEDEFHRIAMSHRVEPWRADLVQIERARPLPDQPPSDHAAER